MFKIGIRVDGKWRYYLMLGMESIEELLSSSLNINGFEKLTVARVDKISLEKDDKSND